MTPNVSVIIPVYNDVNNIENSIKSLMYQTEVNFEVIIIDDGSSDGTKIKILGLIQNDKRFKYFFQENKGVSAARNMGLQKSQGEFISFLDSDDFYEKTFLQKLLSKIILESADVCYSGYKMISPDKTKLKKTKFINKDLLESYIFGRVSIHTSSWMIRKQLIDHFDISFLEGISWGEDFDFFCQVLFHSRKNVFVKEYLTNYRLSFEKNRLSTFSIEKIDIDFDSCQNIIKKLNISNNETLERALINYRFQALLVYRLLLAIEFNIKKNEILHYYEKYYSYLKRNSFDNGLRSIKLLLKKITLNRKIRNLS